MKTPSANEVALLMKTLTLMKFALRASEKDFSIPALLHDERQRKQGNDFCNTVHMEHQN